MTTVTLKIHILPYNEDTVHIHLLRISGIYLDSTFHREFR